MFVAGDPERKHMEKCDTLGGILYHPNQIKFAVSSSVCVCVCVPVWACSLLQSIYMYMESYFGHYLDKIPSVKVTLGQCVRTDCLHHGHRPGLRTGHRLLCDVYPQF